MPATVAGASCNGANETAASILSAQERYAFLPIRTILWRRVTTSGDTLEARLAQLEAELDAARKESDAQAQQLERYAADLRETFMAERAQRARLQESYMSTVRALSNAVEARDSYTDKHAERVAGNGQIIARQMGSRQ